MSDANDYRTPDEWNREWAMMLEQAMSPWVFPLPVATDRWADFARLARSFPTLRECPNSILRAGEASRFDPHTFDEWVVGQAQGEYAVLMAGAFIIQLFSQSYPARCGPFNATQAIFSWDDEHRYAFMAWVRKPWRP